MVQCCNPLCSNGSWFHLGCVHLEHMPQGDWYCGEKCTKSRHYIGCICATKKVDDIIRCTLGAECKGRETYHRKCLLGKGKVVGGKLNSNVQCTRLLQYKQLPMGRNLKFRIQRALQRCSLENLFFITPSAEKGMKQKVGAEIWETLKFSRFQRKEILRVHLLYQRMYFYNG